MSQGKQRPLDIFFSCEPFEQALLVNLMLSKRARGGCYHISHTQGPLCTKGPQGQGLDAPLVTVLKSALYVEVEIVGFVPSICSHIANEAATFSGALFFMHTRFIRR